MSKCRVCQLPMIAADDQPDDDEHPICEPCRLWIRDQQIADHNRDVARDMRDEAESRKGTDHAD